MKRNMVFDIDKTAVVEGDVVNIHWNCPPGSQVRLCIDNGYRSAAMDVEPNGTKQFRLHRSKGRTKLILTATLEGKSMSRKIAVRVKKMKVEKAEVIDDGWKSRRKSKSAHRIPFRERWNLARSSFKYVWQALPERKRLAYVVLFILSMTMLLSLISPKMVSVGITMLAAYLIYIIFKR